jgi:hypothetical protein
MVVLVMENDGFINMMARDELQREGYEVVSAYSADSLILRPDCSKRSSRLLSSLHRVALATSSGSYVA